MRTLEAVVQQNVLLAAARKGIVLFRNNVGAAKDRAGRVIRYGLCNDSAAVNKKLKSSDLVGITPVVITQDMVGTTVGVFTAYEVKRGCWKFSGTDRELAQLAFLGLVISHGGIAEFINDADDL